MWQGCNYKSVHWPVVPLATFSRNHISRNRRKISKLILPILQSILHKLENGRPSFFSLDGQIPLDMKSAQLTTFITLQQNINAIEKAWASTQSQWHMLCVHIKRIRNKTQLGKMSTITILIFQSSVFFFFYKDSILPNTPTPSFILLVLGLSYKFTHSFASCICFQ